MALAHFVKRVDFETVARFASVTVVSDGKSEADLIWLALIALRNALAKADVEPRRERRADIIPLTTCWSRSPAKAKTSRYRSP
jgi:hypothetical protein